MTKLRGHEQEIMEMYKQRIRVAVIAEKFNVHDTTITKLLHKLKAQVDRRDYKPQAGPRKRRVSNYHWNKNKQEPSPELLAQRAVNTKYNNDPNKGIKHIRTNISNSELKLIRNILNKAYLTA